MTLKKIINQLVTLGYRVTARKRTDGGYLIQSINDIKYTAAEGNKVAREILGISLSQKKTNQLKSIARPKLPPLPKEIKNQIARINRRLRRIGKKYKGKPERITTKQVRENIKKFGLQEVQRKLDSLERYKKGYARLENIKWFLVRILRDNDLWPSPEWDKIYQYIVHKSMFIFDKDLMASYNVLYDAEHKLALVQYEGQGYINDIVKDAYYKIVGIIL